jgi:hypothetical protein
MSKKRNIRRRRRAQTRYLVQEREGQEDRVLVYTEALAARKDMFPVSEEEAMEIQREKYPDLFEQPAVEQPAEAATPEPEPEQTSESVIAEAAAAGDEAQEEEEFLNAEDYEVEAPKTDPKNRLQIDPDTDPEIQMIRGFTTKNQLESYLLFQHQVEIDTNKKKLKDLVEDAISILITKRMEKVDGSD